LDRDPAQLGELVDAGFAAKATVARSLHASERHLRLVMHGRSIDVADSGLDLLRQLDASSNVASEDRRGKAVLGVVRELYGLLGRLDARDRHLRAEGLLPEQRHVGRHLVDHDSLHDRSLALTTTENLGALRRGLLNELLHTINSRLADDRAE